MAGSINDELYKALKGNYLQPLSLEDMYDDNALFRQGSSGQINDIMFGKTKAYGGQSVQDALYAYASTLGSATLSLNFLLGVLDPRITFTRGSAATYFDSTGRLATASNDAPRFDYDPVTLACKGLLIEESRTNLLMYSQGLDVSGWSLSSSAITPNTTTAPDGTLTASTLTISAFGGAVYQSVTVTPNTVYTGTVFAKAGTVALADLRFAFYNNTTPGFFGVDIVPTLISTHGTYNRYSCSITTPASCTSMRFYPHRNSAVGAGTLILWGAQLEAGSFATSYIPTTSAQVTRAADSASMTGANFSSWFNQVEGTFVSEQTFGYVPSAAQYPGVYAASNNTYAESYQSYFTATNSVAFEVRDGGVDQALIMRTDAAPAKIASSYKVNDIAASVDGGAASTDVLATLPTPDRLFLGANAGGTVNLNGWLRRLNYYPTRLPNATLQALSA